MNNLPPAGQYRKGFQFYWYMSWRMLWRDWRGGELNILVAALVIAVTSITTVSFFTDRIERGLQTQSAELIAADLVIASRRADVYDYIQEARQNDFQVALTQQFRSVVPGNERPQLVEVKAVSEDYPLRGVLRISDTAFGPDEVTAGIPASGEAWVEARLLQTLNIKIGDSIQLGNSTLVLRKVLRYEPDRAGDLFSLAPRILMNFNDLDATGLVTNNSLVSYSVLIAGEHSSISHYRTLIEKRLRKGENLVTFEQGRPELNTALNRAQQFLGLAAMVSVLLAGVAVASAANRFSVRHLATSAMFRCLGATQNSIIKLFSLEMLWLSLLAGSAGCILGMCTQFVITELLDQLVLTKLPAPSFKAVIPGYATGILVLLGFALPPLLALRRAPPLRVLRKDITSRPASAWLVYLAVVLCMSLLLYWQIGDLKLVAMVTGGMLLVLVMLAIAAYLLIILLNQLRGRVGIAWRFGLANISRRPAGSVIQIVAFGLGIMVMLLLSAVRSDILNDWQNSLPEKAPNHFVINVQADQVAAMNDYFKAGGIADPILYPMVRARLLTINGKNVNTDDYESERARHLITREFNLSWAEFMQIDNELVSGRWWGRDDYGSPLLSLEEGLADTLQLKLNDKVGFDVNGKQMDFTVINLRSVEWDSFNINFFTVVPPGVLEDKPASWVTSVYLDRDQRQMLNDLVRTFPNVTLIDVEVIMQRVRGIISRVSLAVEFIFLFTILAGLAVLFAAIQSKQDERRFESAVLRTLGARKKTLILGLLAEFAVLGTLSGFLAGLSATSLAWLLAEYIFKFEYQADITLALTGVVSGAVIVIIAGLLGTRSVLTHPPIKTLRENTT